MDGFKPIHYMGNITVEDAVVDEIKRLCNKEKTTKEHYDIDAEFFKKNYNKFTPG